MVLSCAVALAGSSTDMKSLRLIEKQLIFKSFYKAFCVFVALHWSWLPNYPVSKGTEYYLLDHGLPCNGLWHAQSRGASLSSAQGHQLAWV